MKLLKAAFRLPAKSPISFCLFLMLLGFPAASHASEAGAILAPLDTIEIHVSLPDGPALTDFVADVSMLNGVFTIDKAGMLSLPIVGPVPAAGLDEHELAEQIASRFQVGSRSSLRPAMTVQRRQSSAAADRRNVVPRREVEPAPGEQLQALERERSKAEASRRELAEARTELLLKLCKDAEAKTSGAREENLQREMPARQELSTCEVEENTCTQPGADPNKQAAALEQQRQIAEGLASDLALAQRAFERLKTEAVAARDAAQASLAEMRQALEAERRKAALLGRDVDAARRELDTMRHAADRPDAGMRANSNGNATQEHTIEEQRQKAEGLARDLTLARLEVERLKAEAVKSRQAAEASLAQTTQALEAERQKSGLLERDLAAARRSVDALQAKVAPAAAEQTAAIKSRQAAEASLAQTTQALEAERQKSGLLERDLAAARRSVDALQAKVEPAAAEQTAAIKSRQAAEASLAETTQALEAERQKSGLLERDLAAARRSVDALQAKVAPAAAEQTAALKSRQAAEASLAENTQALEAERQKSGLLERDLAAARRSVDALQAKVEPAAAEQTAAVKGRQAAEASLAETTQALEAERQKSDLLEHDLAAAREENRNLKVDGERRPTRIEREPNPRTANRPAAHAEVPVPTPAPRAKPREIRNVKVRKPARSVRRETFMLPTALLPTQPPIR